METSLANQELRKFVAPEFIFGWGARKLAAQYAQNYGANHVLIVTDEGLERAGWLKGLLEELNEVGIASTIFDKVTPNPRDHQVMDGAALYEKANCDLIIAMGGGSPMDCAKGIGIVCSNNRHILEFEGVDEVPIPASPLICVPSTAGTSADVSQFAIINDSNRNVKIAIISKTVVPDVALIDPEITVTMDPYLTACTGMDALTHAIEAYVSNAQSVVTDLHALEAIRIITMNLEQAIQNPKDSEARSQMMLASMYAGLAFSNASLGAVHAMAHSLGGLLDLPHGECNSLLLEHVVSYNYDVVPERYKDIANVMGIVSNGSTRDQKKDLVNALSTLRKKIGITTSLGEIGVNARNIPNLAAKAIMDPCMVTNPRNPTQEEIEKIYAAAT
jgi:alcohol dehydrogenase class IV